MSSHHYHLGKPDIVVTVWPDLPEALKAGILLMVKAALGGRPSDRS